MKSRPIIFDGESVRAILDGRKTQTRRVVKPQFGKAWGQGVTNQWPESYSVSVDIADATGAWRWLHCPYGKPGDELWVREAWAIENASKLKLREFEGGGNPDWIYYRDPVHIGTGLSWRSPIHMPRWASRLTLRVTEVRVERLQEISEAGIAAEGVKRHDGSGDGPLWIPFAHRWDSINAKRGFSWDSNPWVWVVAFAETGGTER